jgi:hypothetical protein
MAIPGMQEVQTLATKYSKPQLAHMAQSGLIEPTVAVMAGMLIDRIVQNSAKAPVTTVAEDVLNPPQQPTAMPMAPQGQEQFQPPQEQPQPEAPPQDASQGMPGLPSNLPTNMAGGGIISFAEGAVVKRGGAPDYSAYGSQFMDAVRAPPTVPIITQDFAPVEANPRHWWESEYSYGRRKQAEAIAAKQAVDNPASVPYSDPMGNVVDGMRGPVAKPPAVGIATLPAAAKPPMPAAAAPQTAPRQRPASIAPPGMEPPPTAAAPTPPTAPAPTARAATPETPIVMPSYGGAYAQAQTQLERNLPKDDPFAEYKAELAGNKKKSDEDLKDSAWMRVAEFGLGMAAGSSPYALVNAGKAGVDAIKGYGQDLKEKKTLDREDRKTLADIKRMEHAEKRDNVFKTADMAQKILSDVGADTRAQLQSNTQIRVQQMSGDVHRETTAAQVAGRSADSAADNASRERIYAANNAVQRETNQLMKQGQLDAKNADIAVRAAADFTKQNALSYINNPDGLADAALAYGLKAIKMFNPGANVGDAPPPKPAPANRPSMTDPKYKTQ